MGFDSVKVGISELIEFAVFIAVIGILLIFGADIWMILSVGVLLILCFVCLKNIYQNVFFFFFLASLFIYLMSGDLAELLFDQKYYLQFGNEANIHAHLCIFLSLTGCALGYLITSSKARKFQRFSLVDTPEYSGLLVRVQFVSRYFYIFAYIILLIHTLDTVRFVAAYGYVAYYTSFSPMLPSVLVKIGEYAPLTLCIYLVTLPRKKEAYPILLTYLLYAFVALFVGSRGNLIYNAIFIISYCFYRNYTDKGKEIWISKKMITAMICIVPFLLAFLFLYEYIRTDRAVEFESLGGSIVDFFVNIGASSKVIKYGYDYRAIIPKGRFYSLGETLNYFKYSRIFHLFSYTQAPLRHSAQFAQQSHSLDALISYLSMKEQFLDGHGTGSSFIATLYADFGYFGVFLGSVIYGWLFKKISYFDSRHWILSSFKLYMYFSLLKAPRGGYDGFIAAIVNVNNLIFIVFVWLVVHLLRDKITYRCKE